MIGTTRLRPRWSVRVVFRRRCGGAPSRFDHKPSTFPDQPATSIIDETRLPPSPRISNEMIHHLERLSLVRFSDEAAVSHLLIAVRYAQRLAQIDTDGIQPMSSVLEDEALRLRSDETTPEDTADRKIILSNAAKNVEEMYFVAPIGNVPLEEREDKIGHKEIKKLKNMR